MNNHKPFIISIIFLVILMAAPSISAAASTTVYVTDTGSNEISVEDDKIAIDKSSFIWFASGCGATIIIRKIIKIFQGD